MNPEGAFLKNEGPIVLLFQQLPWNGLVNHSHLSLTVPEAESLISWGQQNRVLGKAPASFYVLTVWKRE